MPRHWPVRNGDCDDAVANAMLRKSDTGAEAAARWKAFSDYLRNIDKYTDVAAQKEIWDRWLLL
jgi:hypothetical protein